VTSSATSRGFITVDVDTQRSATDAPRSPLWISTASPGSVEESTKSAVRKLRRSPLFAASTCTALFDGGAARWLYVVALVCIWNALKFIVIGPVSAVFLLRCKRAEDRARRRSMPPHVPAPAESDLASDGCDQRRHDLLTTSGGLIGLGQCDNRNEEVPACPLSNQAQAMLLGDEMPAPPDIAYCSRTFYGTCLRCSRCLLHARCC